MLEHGMAVDHTTIYTKDEKVLSHCMPRKMKKTMHQSLFAGIGVEWGHEVDILSQDNLAYQEAT